VYDTREYSRQWVNSLRLAVKSVGFPFCARLEPVALAPALCQTRSRSYFTTDSQSVSQYVLASSTVMGLATRYYFLSECCCQKFVVLYLSIRTRNHTLLSHLRLPQPGGSGSHTYIPQSKSKLLYD
jgi:hypothetical protein